MTINLNPDIVAGLEALAAAHGLSIEDFLRALIEDELPVALPDPRLSDGPSGMVWEEGLLIYGAGTSLPTHFIQAALKRSREDRSKALLGCWD